jgi:hypothetical protein
VSTLINCGIVYRFFDANDVLLYIGVTVPPFRKRYHLHRTTAPWFVFVARSTESHFDQISDADLAEIDAIVTEKPVFNKRNNRTTAAAKGVEDYLRKAGRLDLLSACAIKPFREKPGSEDHAVLERAEIECGGNKAEMRRRLMAYALENMPEGWRPETGGWRRMGADAGRRIAA